MKEIALRTCKYCGLKAYTPEDLKQFVEGKNHLYGYKPFCKLCYVKICNSPLYKEYREKYYENNKLHFIEYSRKYYRIHKLTFKERSKTRHEKMKQKAIDLLGGKCSTCGYDKCISSLEFHHIDNGLKESNISKLLLYKNSWSKIEKEIKKCTLLCANCHRELHYKLSRMEK